MTTPRLVTLVDAYQHVNVAQDAELARRLGISRQSLSLWRKAEFRGLSDRSNLGADASVIGRPYREILDAAIRVLSEATRLSNHRVRRTADGGWEPDPWATQPASAVRVGRRRAPPPTQLTGADHDLPR